jgi:hypothetical protein
VRERGTYSVGSSEWTAAAQQTKRIETDDSIYQHRMMDERTDE